jgi:transcriptional regulator with XRE-family HTH domain
MAEADITAAQCRAGRALLKWSQRMLAKKSRVGVATIQNFEAEKTEPIAGTLILLRQAFEAAGIEFLPDDNGGIGLRLRKPAKR